MHLCIVLHVLQFAILDNCSSNCCTGLLICFWPTCQLFCRTCKFFKFLFWIIPLCNTHNVSLQIYVLSGFKSNQLHQRVQHSLFHVFPQSSVKQMMIQKCQQSKTSQAPYQDENHTIKSCPRACFACACKECKV